MSLGVSYNRIPAFQTILRGIVALQRKENQFHFVTVGTNWRILGSYVVQNINVVYAFRRCIGVVIAFAGRYWRCQQGDQCDPGNNSTDY